MKNIEIKSSQRTLKGNCVVGKISWLSTLLGKPVILDEKPGLSIISLAVTVLQGLMVGGLVMLLLGFLI